MIRKDATHQINNAIETGSKDWMITMQKTLERLYWNGEISEETLDSSLKQLIKD